jgi:hypothetical protein
MPATTLRDLEGRGHGEIRRLVSEAFNSGSDAVFAHIDGKDKASIAAIVKLGFSIEGKNQDEIIFVLYPGEFKP